MKLLDANILLYSVDSLSPKHKGARTFLEEALSGPETIGFAWMVLLAFLRLSTNSRIFDSSMTASEALDVIDGWLQLPNTTILHPTDRHAAVLRELLHELGSAGNLTSDAHLAALAIEHGAELCSFDADFSRFPGLRWTSPPSGKAGP